jgi:hypothetical protein
MHPTLLIIFCYFCRLTLPAFLKLLMKVTECLYGATQLFSQTSKQFSRALDSQKQLLRTGISKLYAKRINLYAFSIDNMHCLH